MKIVCANCDLGLKRSECSDIEYTECECRRWIVEVINKRTLSGFEHVLDEALEMVYENKNDLRNNRLSIAKHIISEAIE